MKTVLYSVQNERILILQKLFSCALYQACHHIIVIHESQFIDMMKNGS